MRIAFNIALIISLLFLPWFVGAFLLIVACFVIKNFYEVLIYGIFFDSLYGTNFGIYGFKFVATVYSLVVFITTSLIRRRLSW